MRHFLQCTLGICLTNVHLVVLVQILRGSGGKRDEKIEKKAARMILQVRLEP